MVYATKTCFNLLYYLSSRSVLPVAAVVVLDCRLVVPWEVDVCMYVPVQG